MISDATDDGYDPDWSFTVDDLAVEPELSSDVLSSDVVERLERDRARTLSADEARKADAQAEEEEQGRQQRQNVRVMAHVPMEVKTDTHGTVMLRTRDISAGGVGFATRLPLELEDTGELTIRFPSWNCSHRFTVKFIKPILAGCQIGAQLHFDEDEEHDQRERLVKQVFAMQREQLQERA